MNEELDWESLMSSDLFKEWDERMGIVKLRMKRKRKLSRLKKRMKSKRKRRRYHNNRNL